MYVYKATIMDTDAVGRALKRIAHEIVEAGGVEGLALIGIHRRGVPIAAQVAGQIQAIAGERPPVGSLDITLYRDDLSQIADAPTVSATQIPFDVAGKRVVLLDDVIYTGRTARAGIDALFAMGRPARVELGVLVDRGHREVPVRADYVGKNIPTSLDELVAVSIPPIDRVTNVSIYEKQAD